MLRVPFQRDPLSGEGARLHGGRWNRRGVAALYMASEHQTAIAEYHQEFVFPGTLAAYDVESDRIVDLTGAGTAGIDLTLARSWLRVAEIEHEDPPGWLLADQLIAAGADGALVPSVRHRGGENLVLWRWSLDGSDDARVRVIDPLGDLANS